MTCLLVPVCDLIRLFTTLFIQPSLRSHFNFFISAITLRFLPGATLYTAVNEVFGKLRMLFSQSESLVNHDDYTDQESNCKDPSNVVVVRGELDHAEQVKAGRVDGAERIEAVG